MKAQGFPEDVFDGRPVDYLEVDVVIAGLEERLIRTSVILTGSDAKGQLCDYADLVSEMHEIEHPFKQGIKV